MKKTQTGFTVVELLMYMGLLSLFMTVLVTLFVSVMRFQLTVQSTSSLTQDGRYIMTKIGQDLDGASAVLTPGTLGASTPTLQFVKNGVTYTYSLDAGGNLVLTGGGKTGKLNGLDTGISDISFRRVGFLGGSPTVQIIFTINSQVAESGGPRTQTIQTTYGLR